jgi:hypothetical protein
LKTLPQIQAEQRAAGLVARRDDDESFDGTLSAATALVPACPTEPKGHTTQKLDLPGTVFVERPPVKGAGFTRLLPPTVQTMATLGAEWIAANWDQPSPWCRIEGLPDHPDFQNNLLAFQNAQ